MIESLRVDASLDVDGAAYISKILYSEVAKGNIKFELKSKKRSVGLWFAIDVLQDIYKHLIRNLSIGDLIAIGSFSVWLAEKIYFWLRKEKDKGRHYKPVRIKTRSKEVIITGNEKFFEDIKIKEIEIEKEFLDQ